MNNGHTKFILDTDIGPDVDDAAALYIANKVVRRGDAELLLVTHCTSSPYGVGAIRAINKWCGNGDIPVGTLKKPGFLHEEAYETYNKPLAMSVTEAEREAGDAVQLLRETLVQQEDDSVTIIAIGPLVNMADLLNSLPDEISPLSGMDLVKQKVHALYMMAGCFDPLASNPWTEEHEPIGRTTEWNILMDIQAARDVFAKWPTPIVCGGAEIGNWVITLKDTSILPEDCPVRLAYDLYCKGAGRMSWDLLVVYMAMDPKCECVALSEPGRIILNDQGVTDFITDTNGMHFHMKLTAPADQVARILDQYLAQE